MAGHPSEHDHEVLTVAMNDRFRGMIYTTDFVGRFDGFFAGNLSSNRSFLSNSSDGLLSGNFSGNLTGNFNGSGTGGMNGTFDGIYNEGYVSKNVLDYFYGNYTEETGNVT